MEFLYIVIAIALIFDFINGFHDAANSIATVVSTKVLTPLQAVIWAAVFNFAAFWIFKLHVADAVSKIVKPGSVNLLVIASGLGAAIVWNLITWWKGIPSSSSHTLIGGFAGAGIAFGGFDAINLDKILPPIAFIVLAPVIGMMISATISVITMHICKRFSPGKVDKVFRRLQLLSAAAYSLGHGGNDAQKVMGVIAAALIYTNVPGMHIADIQHLPDWVPLGCYSAISVGTLFGGWRIIKTMGQKITKLRQFEGFSANTAGAITLFGTGFLGIPVSTTHVITGSIIGVGAIKRFSAVKWGVTIDLLWAWILTIPVTGALAALIYYVCSHIIG